MSENSELILIRVLAGVSDGEVVTITLNTLGLDQGNEAATEVLFRLGATPELVKLAQAADWVLDSTCRFIDLLVLGVSREFSSRSGLCPT